MYGTRIESFTFANCLEKTKGDVSFDDFKNSFYFKLRMNGRIYTENQYDILLKSLYKKDEDTYRYFYSKLFRIPLKFVKENYEFIINLMESNKADLIKVAFEMFKKKKSIISGLFPVKATKNTVKHSDELLSTKLEELLSLTQEEDENNIIAKAKLEFAKFYIDYSENEYLREFYFDIIDSFDTDIIAAINKEIAKISGMKKYLHDKDIVNASFEDKEIFNLRKQQKRDTLPHIFKQTFR